MESVLDFIHEASTPHPPYPGEETARKALDPYCRKVAEALVYGKELVIRGGDFAVCEHSGHCCGCCGQGERPCCQDCGTNEFCRRKQV